MVKNKTVKNKNSLRIFVKLAKKYRVSQNGSKKQIAERVSSLRGSYLSKTEKNLILPYLSNNVNKRILLKHKTRKKFVKIRKKTNKLKKLKKMTGGGKKYIFFDDKNTEKFEELEDEFPSFKFEKVERGSNIIEKEEDLDKYLSESNVMYSIVDEDDEEYKVEEEAVIFPDSGIKTPDLIDLIGKISTIDKLIFDWDSTLTLREGFPIYESEDILEYITGVESSESEEEKLKKFINLIEGKTPYNFGNSHDKINNFLNYLFGPDRLVILKKLFIKCTEPENKDRIQIFILTNSPIYAEYIGLCEEYKPEIWIDEYEVSLSFYHTILKNINSEINVRVISGDPSSRRPDKKSRLKKILKDTE